MASSFSSPSGSPSSPSATGGSLMSSPNSSSNFLRNVLRADALSCIACGLLQVGFTDSMADLLKLPPALVAYSGEFLLAYGALVAWLSTRKPVPRPLVALLIAGNLAWAVACAVLLFGLDLGPSALGMAYVAVQALTVIVLAELQYIGLRRQPASPA
jgi:hypothetical protein